MLLPLTFILYLATPVLCDPEDPPQKYIYAHGILMAALFAIFFPLGAILIRVVKSPYAARVHGAWQTIAYIGSLAGFGIGAWLATQEEEWTTSNGHPILGTIVIGFLLLQPIGGFLHHRMYKSRMASGAEPKTSVGFMHRWGGRILLIAGVINGGLGLQLSNEDNNFIIPYSVVAAVLYLIWFAVVLFKKRRTTSNRTVTKTSA